MQITGGCLCKKIRYRCGEPKGGSHCFCEDCRKSSGTAHGSHMVVTSDGFELTGKPKQYDKKADSGNIVSRYFCDICGGPIYSTNSSLPGLVMIRASSLDDPNDFEPKMVVYTDRAPNWGLWPQQLPAFALSPHFDEMPEAAKEALSRKKKD